MPDTAPPSAPTASRRPVLARPIFARHAASLLVLRQDRDGPAVLMGTRGAGHRFMPNRLVFPGGAVERADATAPVAAELPPETRVMLEKAARPRLARALAHAAARELEEETGLSLAPAPGRPPALDGIAYLCRAITPPARPIRFNARFLVVDAARARGEIAGSGELENLRFYGVDEALALDLHPVQRGVLEELRRWRALPEAERRAVRPTPVFRAMKWRME